MAEKIIYCPYTDKELQESETSPEHIFPLSLGGDDQFVIPVDRSFNQKVGSEIDGKFSNEFLMQKKRADFGTRGHSGKTPQPVIKNAKDLKTGRPIQVTMGKELKIWDSINRKQTSPYNRKFQVSVNVDIDLPLRFLAKVALSGGYWVYGETFRKYAAHQELRLIMKGPLNLTKDEKESIRTRCFSPYSGTGELSESDSNLYNFQKSICEIVKGNCLVFVLGNSNLCVFGGVLSTYLGFLNIPADITNFPKDGFFDRGHAIVLSNGKILRWSFRQFVVELDAKLNGGQPKHE